ncbi:hypothetical protein IWX90DRAFT_65804 [Phyllosticta citrichinensis]|uniref:Uncharacterized protein n=1 Tax=Phyllosticta citrichinensis TaxID=1130410 RepID=A0ABR1XHH9_9PEZI
MHHIYMHNSTTPPHRLLLSNSYHAGCCCHRIPHSLLVCSCRLHPQDEKKRERKGKETRSEPSHPNNAVSLSKKAVGGLTDLTDLTPPRPEEASGRGCDAPKGECDEDRHHAEPRKSESYKAGVNQKAKEQQRVGHSSADKQSSKAGRNAGGERNSTRGDYFRKARLQSKGSNHPTLFQRKNRKKKKEKKSRDKKGESKDTVAMKK